MPYTLPLRNSNPLVIAALSTVITPLAVLAGASETLSDLQPRHPHLQTILMLGVLAVLFLFPVLVVVVGAINYVQAHLQLRRLVLTFAALILLFANCYFLTVVSDDRGGTPCPLWQSQCVQDNDIPFIGVHPAWRWLPGIDGRRISVSSIVLAYVDCFHYSVVTASTFGYGDIHANRWYTKLLKDLQILLSLGLTVLAVSRYFSSLSLH